MDSRPPGRIANIAVWDRCTITIVVHWGAGEHMFFGLRDVGATPRSILNTTTGRGTEDSSQE